MKTKIGCRKQMSCKAMPPQDQNQNIPRNPEESKEALSGRNIMLAKIRDNLKKQLGFGGRRNTGDPTLEKLCEKAEAEVKIIQQADSRVAEAELGTFADTKGNFEKKYVVGETIGEVSYLFLEISISTREQRDL